VRKLSGFDRNLFTSLYSADVIECDLRATLGLMIAQISRKDFLEVVASLEAELVKEMETRLVAKDVFMCN
jgi:hypothetical protein